SLPSPTRPPDPHPPPPPPLLAPPPPLLAGRLRGLPPLQPRRVPRRRGLPLPGARRGPAGPLPGLLAPALHLRRLEPAPRGCRGRRHRPPGGPCHRITRQAQGHGLRRDLHRVRLRRPPPRAQADVAPLRSAGSPFELLEEATGLAFRFVIGKSNDKSKMAALEREVEEYDDFVLLDLEEEYSRLPYKTLAFFKAAYALFDSDFYVKADDDIYLRPDKFSFCKVHIHKHIHKHTLDA
uniref:Hexosyltransferase n=2 Tax=Aegilops tauschii subsp. strangulata TaxID=200361 RepID=A0A453P9Q3_AEGTS